MFLMEKKSPYSENDKTNPVNYYGFTKCEGEKKILQKRLKNSVIIRTSWLYSDLKDNFLQNILNQFNNNKELRVVNNQVGSPTYSYDLALFILTILPKLNSNQAEIYNFSNEGFCSRYEFAKEILKLWKNQ